MHTFLYDVLSYLKSKNVTLSDVTFILPSKRAGLFLKHELIKVETQTIFSPEILSIEDFVKELSGLEPVSNTELLFELYSVYKTIIDKDQQDTFDVFSKWAQLLLQDFNEIDRYLIPHDRIFSYLSAVKQMEKWTLDDSQPTEMVTKYVTFWNRISQYYQAFTERLLERKIGYQGLIYREAVEQLEGYIQNNNKHHIFLGFNALNTAEETIIQELLHNDLAEIYWDAESHFMDNQIHDAGLFLRRHKSQWKYFEKHPFNSINNNYKQPKNINVYGIPKQIGQAKQIGSLLKHIQTTNPNLEGVAVVLADENLLPAVLNSLPEGITALNITMGFPLKSIAISTLFEQLFQLHKNTSKGYYYKDVIAILSHQYITPLLNSAKDDAVTKAISIIQDNNLVFLHLERLLELFPSQKELITLLFKPWQSVANAINNCFELIYSIKAHLDINKSNNLLSLEYTYRFYTLFNELQRLNDTYKHIEDLTTLHNLYKELLNSETLDFKGEPLQGLQIMGMLESRVLDFKTVIISSVNEGILPSGKSNNSFIPFDVKIEHNLPTYKEKDAIYTYHFYRLLQRSEDINVLYNTEIDSLLGGEKSRFVTQLELDDCHKISHQIVTPKVPKITQELQEIKKTEDVLTRLKAIAQKGFSPSSLTNYIRNPIDFYKEKVLHIKTVEEVEETVAYNTLGNVIHDTLEELYKPFEGKFLTTEIVENLKKDVNKTVLKFFKKAYKEGDITTGKNLIIFEIAKQYVNNFLTLEIKDLKAGNEIKIIELEAENNVTINIPELDFKVNLTGKVDRVDQYNGTTRVIDYKSGNVTQSKVEIVDWQDLTTDYDKYSKPFQILMYAYMMKLQNKIQLPIEAGIISFKNLNSGLLKFATKPTPKSRTKDTLITEDTLTNFETELKKLIIEICNINISFIEKEV